MNDLISIIVPVYNVEKYIKRCIDSLVNQTYNNLEIILVDDGSPDNCPKICDNYCYKDSRIRVIHKKNGGLADARNVGIEYASGKYISFVDSDDWIPLDSIETLYNNLIKSDSDISIGNLLEVYDDKNIIDKKNNDIECFNTESGLKNLLLLQKYSNSASAKLYSKHLFDSVRYPKDFLYEDLGTTYKVFSLAKKIVYTRKDVYYYFQNMQSIVHQSYSKKRLDGYYFAIEQLYFFEKNFPMISQYAEFRLFYECLFILNDMPLFCKDRIMVFSTLKKYRKCVLKNKNVVFRQKMLCFSSYFGQVGIKIACFMKGLIK